MCNNEFDHVKTRLEQMTRSECTEWIHSDEYIELDWNQTAEAMMIILTKPIFEDV